MYNHIQVFFLDPDETKCWTQFQCSKHTVVLQKGKAPRFFFLSRSESGGAWPKHIGAEKIIKKYCLENQITCWRDLTGATQTSEFGNILKYYFFSVICCYYWWIFKLIWNEWSETFCCLTFFFNESVLRFLTPRCNYLLSHWMAVEIKCHHVSTQYPLIPRTILIMNKCSTVPRLTIFVAFLLFFLLLLSSLLWLLIRWRRRILWLYTLCVCVWFRVRAANLENPVNADLLDLKWVWHDLNAGGGSPEITQLPLTPLYSESKNNEMLFHEMTESVSGHLYPPVAFHKTQ